MPDLRQQLEHCFQGRLCLVGVGSPDHGDDALGVRLAESLEHAGRTARIPPRSGPFSRCTILHAGTAPERQLTLLVDGGFDHVLFLDAVEFGGAPGSVVFLDSSEMQARFPQVSTHRLSLGLWARWIESSGATRVWLLGMQPGTCRAGAPLSEHVRESMAALIDLLAEVMGSRGAELTGELRS